MFFGTGIATCIIVLKKNKTDNNTLFIDASAEFMRGGNKNKLAEVNQNKILQAFTEHKNIRHFAKLVNNADIKANDYNFAVSSYVEQKGTRELVDAVKLNAQIKQIVAREHELRKEIDKIVADIESGLK